MTSVPSSSSARTLWDQCTGEIFMYIAVFYPTSASEVVTFHRWSFFLVASIHM